MLSFEHVVIFITTLHSQGLVTVPMDKKTDEEKKCCHVTKGV